MTDPTYEEMLPKRITGLTTKAIVQGLQVGVPTKWPVKMKNPLTGQTNILGAARALKIGLTTKIINDELWVVRLKPEHDPFNNDNNK